VSGGGFHTSRNAPYTRRSGRVRLVVLGEKGYSGWAALEGPWVHFWYDDSPFQDVECATWPADAVAYILWLRDEDDPGDDVYSFPDDDLFESDEDLETFVAPVNGEDVTDHDRKANLMAVSGGQGILERSIETRPGVQTSEHLWMLVASIVNWIAHFAQSGQLPLKWTVAIQAALAAVYAISRGLAKLGVPAAASLVVDDAPVE
jgi:hypothetical protein